MLVLSRKKDETVNIGEQVEVKVLAIKGNVVRLGISAPDSVKIVRGELSPFEFEMKMPDTASGDVAAFQ